MSSPEQWEEADEILSNGRWHVSMRFVRRAEDALVAELSHGKEQNLCMKRVGAGRTEAPTFVLRIADALDELAKAASALAAEYRRRFG